MGETNEVFQDKPKTEPGKSSRKGINVTIQASAVTGLVMLILTLLEVKDDKFWMAILVPLITGLWHTAQKYIFHKLGVNFQLQLPKILPMLLCATMLLPSCAMVRTTSSDEVSSYNSIGLVLGKGSISDLQAAYQQQGKDADGSELTTIIGHQSSEVKSENALMIETVVQSAINGAIKAVEAAAPAAAPIKVKPPPLISIGFGPVGGEQ